MLRLVLTLCALLNQNIAFAFTYPDSNAILDPNPANTSGCRVSLPDGNWIMDTQNNSATVMENCMARGNDYYNWLPTHGYPNGPYVVTFYDQGMARASVRKGTPASGAPACPTGWVCPDAPIYTSKIGAWYSIWHRSTDGNNPTVASNWSTAAYKPVLGGFYDSMDQNIYAAHFQLLHQIGVEFLILDDTNGITSGLVKDVNNNVTDWGIAGNITNLFSYISSLGTSQPIRAALAIGLCHWQVGLVDRDTCQTTEATWSYQVSSTYSSSYYKVGGLPLLVNHKDYTDANVYLPDWTDSRFVTRFSSAASSLFTVPKPRNSSGWWGWVSEFAQYGVDGTAKYETVTIGPGADNRRAGGSMVIDRENGAYFMREWVRAIKLNPQNIVLASFNEFGDGNAIEPATARTDLSATDAPKWVDSYGTETPYLYVNIATAYANLRTGLQENVYFRDEDGSQAYYVQSGKLYLASGAPAGNSIVILPAGTIKGLLGGASPYIHLPANGTLVQTSDGSPAGVMFNGRLLRFASLTLAQKFSSGSILIDPIVYHQLPYGGTIATGSVPLAAPGFAPAFVSDLGEIFPTNCQAALNIHGVTVRTISVDRYGQYTNAGSLVCTN